MSCIEEEKLVEIISNMRSLLLICATSNCKLNGDVEVYERINTNEKSCFNS